MLKIETERLVLRPHTLDHLETLNAWWNDGELTYYDDDQPPDAPPDSLEETRRWLERVSRAEPEATTLHYAIHKKADEKIIGYGQVAFVDRYNRHCKLGITVGAKDEWGKGYAREALSTVIDYCFEELQLNRIGAEIYDFNTRSLRLFEGLGFQREGVIRQQVLKSDGFHDEYLYGLLRSEWQAPNKTT